MQLNIAVIKGDGGGPEIIPQTMGVLEAIGRKYGHTFNFTELLMGGCAIDKTGMALPQQTLEGCLKSDSVLFGAIGDARHGNLPERALLKLREAMGLYANIRPAVLFAPLKKACPLREDIADKGIDMIIVRELTGGIYFGQRGREKDAAFDTEKYNIDEIKRIAKVAFETAMARSKKVTSVDKANVLESSRLWREVVHEVAKDYPDVEVSDMYVDNAAMQLVLNPSQFDVILASNMFGDILSDEAAAITGSIGLLASASLGVMPADETDRHVGDGLARPAETGNLNPAGRASPTPTKIGSAHGYMRRGLYEPIHGSAPDIAGQDKANPIASILSGAMMLRHSFGLDAECAAIETAVSTVLHSGARTFDIADKNTKKIIGTREMGEMIVRECK